MNSKTQKRPIKATEKANSKKVKKTIIINESVDAIELIPSIEEKSVIVIDKIQFEENMKLLSAYKKLVQENEVLQKICDDYCVKIFDATGIFICNVCLAFCDEDTSIECRDGDCHEDNVICKNCYDEKQIDKCSACDVSEEEESISTNDLEKIHGLIELQVTTLEQTENLLGSYKHDELIVIKPLTRQINFEVKKQTKINSIIESYRNYTNKKGKKLYECFACSKFQLSLPNTLKLCYNSEINSCNNHICKECYEDFERIICDQCKSILPNSETANILEKRICGANECIETNGNYDILSKSGQIKLEIISLTRDVFDIKDNEAPSIKNIKTLILIPRHSQKITKKDAHLELLRKILDETASIKSIINSLIFNSWYFCVPVKGNKEFDEFFSTFCVTTKDLIDHLKINN